MHSIDILNLSAAIVPSRIATISEGQHQSYAELLERSNQLAKSLHAMGIVSGDRIIVLDVNSTQQLEVYFAAMLLNAIFVPLNFRARSEELTYPISLTTPKFIFSGLRYTQIIDALSITLDQQTLLVSFGASIDGNWINYESLFDSEHKDSDVPAMSESDDENTAALLFTAGTTGSPKAVNLNHHSFTSFMLSSAEPADPDIEERTLLSLPLYHIAGLQSALTSIFSGRTIVFQKQFEAREWLQIVEKEKVQRVLLVPTMLKQVLEHPDRSSYDLSSVELITYGGAPMPISVIEKAIADMPKVSFINAFGQTETGSTITSVPPEDHVLKGPSHLVEKRRKHLASIGKPLPDVEVKIIDEDGAELPQGEVGEIAASGDRLMQGYWGENNHRVKWLRTGDLGYMDADGYIYLQGRKKDFIKRGGEMVSPEEVETVLRAYPGVSDSAVIGLHDETWGEKVVAVVVTCTNSEVTEESILEYVAEKLARYKRPEKIIFIDTLPRNELGKVLKKDLRSWLGAK